MIAAVVMMTLLGGGVGIILYLTARRFQVKENPAIQIVEDLLPGANCGACGKAGCHAFAELLVEEPTVSPCPVADPESVQQIGAVLGVEVKQTQRQVARLICQGHHEHAGEMAQYDGIVSCQAATLLFPGSKSCPYACLGLGSCVAVCKFDAMRIENGIVKIDENKCTACGQCLRVCPKNILALMPASNQVYVACRNVMPGGAARKVCTTACIGCKKCEKVCPVQAVTVTDFLARIDPAICTNCGKCALECPMSSIIDKEPQPAPTPMGVGAAPQQQEQG